jgi:hypothetical protein
MKSKGKPIAAGVLNIIAGILGIIGAIGMFIGFSFITNYWNFGGVEIEFEAFPRFVENIILGLAIPSLIIAILALVGGIFAVQRKQWGLALAGSIAAILSLFPLGIASTVLTAISKEEFE